MKSDTFSLESYNPNKLDESIKKGFKTLIENFVTIIAAAVIVAIFGRAFFGIEIKNFYRWTTWGDILVIVIFSYVMQITMAIKGDINGKRDEGYIAIRHKYKEIRDRIRLAGSPNLDAFCGHYIIKEFDGARRAVLSATPIPYDLWQKHFANLSPREIHKLKRSFKYDKDGNERRIHISRKTKLKLIILYHMEPVYVSPDSLMIEFSSRSRRGGLPTPPEEHLEKEDRKLRIGTVVMSAVTGFIAFRLLAQWSPDAIMSALMTLMCVLSRGFMSYTKHFLAYSNRGVQFTDKQIEILCEYEAWYKPVVPETIKEEGTQQ